MNHESLNYIEQKLKKNENKLMDWTKSLEFMKSMTEVFTNYDIYSNDEMKKLNQNQILTQQARLAGRASGPTQEDSKRLVNLFHLSEMTESEAVISSRVLIVCCVNLLNHMLRVII